MSFAKSIVSSLLVGACAVCVMHGSASAQVSFDPMSNEAPRSQTDWEKVVLRSRHRSPVRTASAREVISGQSIGKGSTQKLGPMPLDDDIQYSSTSPSDNMYPMMGCDTCNDDCTTNEFGSPCGVQGECYDECYGGMCLRRHHWHRLLQNCSFFAGVEGFKGPLDRGRNGNFGFHEGLNFGAPLGGGTELGYQLGFLATQSNFSGERVGSSYQRADRDQVFFTVGIFRRALCGGLQYGIAFDMLHDSYYRKSNLNQIRCNISFVRSCKRELGFFSAVGTKHDDVSTERHTATIEVNDQFAFYYRRYFSGGGEGRFWVGFTGNKDALFGGDIRVPIGMSWALENNFNYVVPRDGRKDEGQLQEAWSVAIRLVWYPGRPANSIRQNPFNPLFNVADNTYFMTRLK